MWGEALLELKKRFQEKIPQARVYIGKEKRPSSSKDYPFIHLIPVESSYDEEKLQLKVVVYFGVMVKEREERDQDEEGTLEFLNFLHAIQGILLQTPDLGNGVQIEPRTYAMKDFSRQAPYFEGEIHVTLLQPYEALSDPSAFDTSLS